VRKIVWLALLLLQLNVQAQEDFKGKIVYNNTVENYDKFLGIDQLVKEDPEGAKKYIPLMKAQFKEKGIEFLGEGLSTMQRKLISKFNGDHVLLETSKEVYTDYNAKDFTQEIFKNGISTGSSSYKIAADKLNFKVTVDKNDRKKILGYDCYKLIITSEEDVLGDIIKDITELYITDAVKIPLHYNVVMEIAHETGYYGLVLEAIYTVKEFGNSKSRVIATSIDIN